MKKYPYWLEEPLIKGDPSKPRDGGILVIGAGLAGSSCAYWLREFGMDDITLVDFEPEKAASFRNCGHILYGTVESMQALKALHGETIAKEIWSYSIDICHEVKHTTAKLGLGAEYAQDGYLVIAIDESERQEHLQSVNILNSMGFQSDFVEQDQLEAMGFRNVFGGRFEKGSAQAHPVKFRNGIVNHCIKNGTKYHSQCQVLDLNENADGVAVSTNHGDLYYDAVVIASNAYSNHFSSFFQDHRLVEPFRGQIIASKPLKEEIPISYPHCFDHGYEYALKSQDNRLIIGGWRNNTPAGEIGTYDLTPNEMVENGLMEFVDRHYSFKEKIEWEHSWGGIMATSNTGFPFIGPTDSPRVYTCAGFTGHGFSWAHGSAKLLAQIVCGEEIPRVAKYFNARKDMLS